MKFKYFSALLITMPLSACSENNDVVSHRDITLEQYVAAKNIEQLDKKKNDSSYKLFLDRAKITDGLLANELKGDISLQVKMQETKSTIVLQSYFSQYLKKKVNQEVVKAYYNKHKNNFSSTDKLTKGVYATIENRLKQEAKTKEYQRLLKLVRN